MGNFTKFLFTTREPLTRPGAFHNSWVVDAQSNPSTGALHEDTQFLVKYGAGTAQNNGSLLAAVTSGIDSAYDVIAATRLRKG